MDKLKLMTYNAKGLKDEKKRESVFYWLKKKKMDLICIQEAHCEESTLNTWEKEWGSKIYASHGTNNSKGVCILTGGNNNMSTKEIKTDPNGRYVIIQVKIGDNKIKLAGYYGPNQDDPEILNKLLSDLDETEGEHSIIMGDFNFVMDVSKDKKGGTDKTNIKCQKALKSWMEDQNMYEAWRILHPEDKTYTWRSNTKPRIFCRLDFFIVSANIMNITEKCEIGPGLKSDHSYVKIITEFNSPPRGKGYWKFDSTLLEEENFKEEIAKTIKQVDDDNPNTEPTLLWETIKSGIRGLCISFASRRRKNMDSRIHKLEDNLKKINQELGTANDEKEKEKLEEQHDNARKDLEDHIDKKARWASSRFKNILYELDEKPTKFFLNQMKERKSNSTLRRLVTEKNEEITEQKEILKEQRDFYKRLYTSNIKKAEEDIEERKKVQEEIFQIPHPQVDLNQWDEMTKEITEEELWKVVLSCPDNKSPGTDGLNNNFYKAFWNQVKPYLMNSIKATLANGHMSISQKQGIITTIPKADKDTSKLKNWRPITLLNQDYKYLAKCLANRCRKVLPDIVDPDQTGFVPNRVIGTNLIKSQCIISHLEELQTDGLLMCIDFEKAFDTVEWDFITKCLKEFNFPPKFTSWVQILYNGISTCTQNNGHSSEFFLPSRGVRQGCPLSPILFVIAVEFLAISIRNNEKIKGITINREEIKISQFADDTCLYIRNDPACITEIFNMLDKFSLLSGLKVNKEKTEILPLGTTSLEDMDINLRKFTKDSVKLLGIHLSTNKELTKKLNYEPIWEKIDNTIKQWQYKGISLQGKITVLKTFVISKLVYALSVLPAPPKEQLEEMQKKMFRFVWDNKQDKIKRDILIGDYKDGGLRMPDIIVQNISLKSSWLKRLMEYDGNWSTYIKEKLPMKDPNYFMECSIKFSDIPNKPEKNNIWNEIILNWCLLNMEYNDKKTWTLHEICQETLWWNSYIKIKGKVIEYKHWSQRGIKYVHHLLDEEGHWLDHTSFQKRHNISIPFTELYGLQNAIKESWGKPSEWKIQDKEEDSRRLLDCLDKKEKTSRIIYSILIEKKRVKPVERMQKWGEDIQEELREEEWKKHLIHIRKIMINTKMQTWVYKYTMRAVPYNKKLYEMGLSPNTLCTFCQEETESIIHLYWECRQIQDLWTFISTTFSININIKLGLLGIQQTCYKRSPGNIPTVQGLERILMNRRNKEREIAIKNNKLISYLERWGERR
jgi:exonuclease III/nitrogen regulatory protein PII-like uncharacterized protein